MNANQMKDMAAFAASKTKGKKGKGKNPFAKIGHPDNHKKTMKPAKGGIPAPRPGGVLD